MSALLGRLRNKSVKPPDETDFEDFDTADVAMMRSDASIVDMPRRTRQPSDPLNSPTGSPPMRRPSLRQPARQVSQVSVDSSGQLNTSGSPTSQSRRGGFQVLSRGAGSPTPQGTPSTGSFHPLPSTRGRGGSAAPDGTRSRGGSTPPSTGEPEAWGTVAAFVVNAELAKQKVENKALLELQDLCVKFNRTALRILRRENLGTGANADDMWKMQDISKGRASREAVEFADSDGDAVRFLLQDGSVHLVINGGQKGQMRTVMYDEEKNCLKAKPWKIGMRSVPMTSRPVLLSHLGALFSKAGVAHNLPAYVAGEEDDASKELAQQLLRQRESMTAVLAELEDTKDRLKAAQENAEGADAATREFMNMQDRQSAQMTRIQGLETQLKKKQLELENLQNALGKRARDEQTVRGDLSDAHVKQEAMKQALDHANAKRREAESALRAREAQVMALKRQKDDGKDGDRVEINRLTCQLADSLDDNGKLKMSLSALEAKVIDLQISLQDAALRRQQAEQALANYENSNQKLKHSLNNIKLDMAQSSGADAEIMEETKRSQIEQEEFSRYEYMFMWFHAERRVIAVKQRSQQQEKTYVQRLEASGRLLLEAEERGRREYQSIWLRAELRQVANNAASGLERNAVIAQREKNKETRYRLQRSRHALTRAIPNPYIRTLARGYRCLHSHMVYAKFLRVRRVGAPVLRDINDVVSLQRAYTKWRLWKSEHTHDRTLAIRAYLQQRPVFYLDEHMHRVTAELEEEHARRGLVELSHCGMAELAERGKVAAERDTGILALFWEWAKGVPVAGTREAINGQLTLVKSLLKMEEQKVQETEKAMLHLRRQREEMSRHNTVLLAEASKLDVLKLFYGHLEGKRALEVEHLQGLVNTLHSIAFPKRRSVSHGGWVLSSLADWKGGGTWEHRFLWLDVMKGQLMYSARDPRLCGGPEVKSIRLANIVAVEVELFTDGLKPPPVSRYQQLGFYIEMNKGGKHRFCAATVGERTEWLDNLRRSLISVWRTAETPITVVSPRLPNSHLAQQSPHRPRGDAAPVGVLHTPSSSLSTHHTARAAMKAAAASPEESPSSPQRSPSYRAARARPRGGAAAPPYIPQLALSQLGAESPPRALTYRQTSMPAGQSGKGGGGGSIPGMMGMPLEHQSYMGL